MSVVAIISKNIQFGSIDLAANLKQSEYAMENVVMAVWGFSTSIHGIDNQVLLFDKVVGSPEDHGDLLLFIGCQSVREAMQIEPVLS